jgi:hypothetical protein
MPNIQSRLDRSEVLRWLEGHREAEKVIRKERIRDLLNRSTEKSWEIYASLTDSRWGTPPDAGQPSYVLLAMSRALDRYYHRTKTSS